MNNYVPCVAGSATTLLRLVPQLISMRLKVVAVTVGKAFTQFGYMKVNSGSFNKW